MDPRFSAETAGAVFVNTDSLLVFCGVFALIGVYCLYCSVRQYGLWVMLPWDTPQVTRGQEDEALRCVLADPLRCWSDTTVYAAGRAALRRLSES